MKNYEQLLRIALYIAFSFLGSQGVGTWDADSGTFTITVESLLLLLTGTGGILATVAWWIGANRR